MLGKVTNGDQLFFAVVVVDLINQPHLPIDFGGVAIKVVERAAIPLTFAVGVVITPVCDCGSYSNGG